MTKEPKKMWRCAKDFMGYCNGEPEWACWPREATYSTGQGMGDSGGTCKRDPKTCMKYRTFTQMLEARLRKGASDAKKTQA